MKYLCRGEESQNAREGEGQNARGLLILDLIVFSIFRYCFLEVDVVLFSQEVVHSFTCRSRVCFPFLLYFMGYISIVFDNKL